MWLWFILFSIASIFLFMTALSGTRFYSLYTGKKDILAIKVVAWLCFLYIIGFVVISTYSQKGIDETVVQETQNSSEMDSVEKEESIQDGELYRQ